MRQVRMAIPTVSTTEVEVVVGGAKKRYLSDHAHWRDGGWVFLREKRDAQKKIHLHGVCVCVCVCARACF